MRKPDWLRGRKWRSARKRAALIREAKDEGRTRTRRIAGNGHEERTTGHGKPSP